MKHKYPPKPGWFACNIPDAGKYAHSLQKQEGIPLTPERLKIAIEEDSFGGITLEECEQIITDMGD